MYFPESIIQKIEFPRLLIKGKSLIPLEESASDLYLFTRWILPARSASTSQPMEYELILPV